MSQPFNLVIDRLRQNGHEPQRNCEGYWAFCPTHDPHNRGPMNLSITGDEDGQAIVECLAGCDPERILIEIGLGQSRPKSEPSGGTSNHQAESQSKADETEAWGEILDRWPKMRPEAFHGLAGEIVRLVEPQTEADSVAVLFQVLAAFGNVIGRRAHFVVCGTRHYLNLFVALVGITAGGARG